MLPTFNSRSTVFIWFNAAEFIWGRHLFQNPFFLITDNSYCKSFVIILCNLKVVMSPLFRWDSMIS